MPDSKMLAEIRQQPQTLADTLRYGKEIALALRGKLRPRLVILAARGTSDNAAQFGRYLIEITTGIPVSLAAPSIITLYGAPLDFRDALVVGISQSGESTDTNAYLEEASKRGATTVGITNEAGSTLARIGQHTLLVHAGKEESVAATKTYTGQMMAMYLLACALGGAIDWTPLEEMAACAAEALKLESSIAALAPHYASMNRAACVGRGLNYANALEFGLKLAETCYVVAERFSAADFLHGPIALLEPEFPLFVFAPPGVTEALVDELLGRASAAKADVMVFTEAAHPCSGKYRCILLPPSPSGTPADLYSAIPYIIPAQLFAAHLAAAKGLDADRPRTLSKITKTV
jgi:glucosamine--fructose-6-phosphate aminotransferase (isomerizing)